MVIGHNDPQGENDVVIEFDIKRMSHIDYRYLQQIPEILSQSDVEIGDFRLGNLQIYIAHLESYEKTLINIS
jgi:hypothetical protein